MHSDVDWMVWTPITKGYCKLHDLRTVYSLSDVMNMHEAIAEIAQMERTQRDPR